MQKVKNLFCENRGRKLAVLLLGAFGYALLTALCSQIEQFGATAWSRTLARFAAAFPIALVVLAALLAIAMPKLMCRPRESQKPFCTWGAALLFFACYTPMLLIEFPGSFTYDVTAQTFQIAKNSYSMFYPLAHTLLLKFCLDAYGLLQSFEKCALLCSAIQMTLVSICFALVCASISRACSRRTARIAAAFFALCPYHAVFASNFTKDVLFAAFLAVFVAYTLEYVQAGGLCARRMAMCVFAGMMACLLRNNMIYAMLVWVALLLVFGRGMRRAACWALLAAVLGMGANQALAALTHADSGDAKEMLSVPAQQLSRVYKLAPETFTDEEMVAMDTYFGNEGYTRYDATLADFTKNDLSTDVILEDKAGFFKLWLTVGQRRPDLYLDALLELDLPFLYPYRAYAGTAKYIETGMSPRALTMPFGGDDMNQPARFKGVRDWLDEHIWSTGARDIPALRWVFNAGVVIWLMLLSALFAMYTGNWKRFGILLLPILLWGTYLLGPVMQGRYLYPFVCMLPLLLAVPKEGETERTVGALPQVRETRIVAFSSLRFPPRT